MESSPLGGFEILIIILLILGLWWLLSLFPKKIAATACGLLVSLSPVPPQTPAPLKQPAAERNESLLA